MQLRGLVVAEQRLELLGREPAGGALAQPRLLLLGLRQALRQLLLVRAEPCHFLGQGR